MKDRKFNGSLQQLRLRRTGRPGLTPAGFRVVGRRTGEGRVLGRESVGADGGRGGRGDARSLGGLTWARNQGDRGGIGPRGSPHRGCHPPRVKVPRISSMCSMGSEKCPSAGRNRMRERGSAAA